MSCSFTTRCAGLFYSRFKVNLILYINALDRFLAAGSELSLKQAEAKQRNTTISLDLLK